MILHRHTPQYYRIATSMSEALNGIAAILGTGMDSQAMSGSKLFKCKCCHVNHFALLSLPPVFISRLGDAVFDYYVNDIYPSVSYSVY